jgi:hypothetical protein
MSPRQEKTHADALRWFKEKKRDLHREIRAFNDFVVARDAILRIQQGIDPELDPHSQLTSSLFQQAVTFYARQFKQALNQYAEKQNYPVGSLAKHDNFDGALHIHIIGIRDQLVAHNDSRELPPQINVLTFTMRQDGLPVATFPIGATLTSYSLASAATTSFLTRMAAHLSACVEVAEAKMHAGLHNYIDEAIKYPNANFDSREGPNLKIVEGDSVSLKTNETFARLDLESMRTRLVNEPVGSLGKEEFTFRMVTYSVVKEKVAFLLNGAESFVHLRNDIRSERDVKNLIPKPASKLWKPWRAVVRWFQAPFFDAWGIKERKD